MRGVQKALRAKRTVAARARTVPGVACKQGQSEVAGCGMWVGKKRILTGLGMSLRGKSHSPPSLTLYA